ncbi:MAG: hypothetical protein RLZZ568_737 [Cyanobacteriota bacterium]
MSRDVLLDQVGIVVIGRNEGDRLQHCLRSVVGRGVCVYVDSGSHDDSLLIAKGLKIDVIALEARLPFTAARARNAGVNYLVTHYPHLAWIQFVDGDCEMVDGWLDTALMALQTHPQWAVVCGRRREEFPHQSVFNRLCDLEWNTPIGEATACGGDSMMRLTAFQEVGGFYAPLIAGEEPELCYRLRQQGWQVQRLAVDMTRHDAQMFSWGQWWRRTMRSGHAFAETASLYPDDLTLGDRRQLRSNLLWGGILPLFIMASVYRAPWLSGLISLTYLAYLVKIYRNQRQRNVPREDAWIYAVFCVLGRFPSLHGQLLSVCHRWLGKKTPLIEYSGLVKRKKSVPL